MSEEKATLKIRDDVAYLTAMNAVIALYDEAVNLFSDADQDKLFFDNDDIYAEVAKKFPDMATGTISGALSKCAKAGTLISYKDLMRTGNIRVFSVSPYLLKHKVDVATKTVSKAISDQFARDKKKKESTKKVVINPDRSIEFELGDYVRCVYYGFNGRIVDFKETDGIKYIILVNSDGDTCSTQIRTDAKDIHYMQLLAKKSDVDLLMNKKFGV